MADNTTLNSMSGGDVISTDDLGSSKVQDVKVGFGTDGNLTRVSSSNPLPVDPSGVTSPVSIASMPTTPVTGTFWQTTQPVSGTVTANAGTNMSTASLALESGGNLATIAGTVSSSKVNVNLASGSIPSGSNTIGSVGVASYGNSGPSNWTWTTATSLNTTDVVVNNALGYSTLILQVNPNSSVAGGAITIEGSLDNSNWNPINVQQINGETGLYPYNGTALSYVASTPIIYQVAIGGLPYVRVRLSTAITGAGGSVSHYATLSTSSVFGATSQEGVVLLSPINGNPLSIDSNNAAYARNMLAGTNALQKDDTNYGDGVTSGIASGALRLYNSGGTDYDRARAANSAAATTGTGLLGAGMLAFDGTNWQKTLVDGSGYLKVNVAAGGGSGGTSSSYGSSFPSTGTAIGVTDGTNMQAIKQGVTSGSILAQAVQQETFGSTTAFTITLASLATSSAGVGRQSTMITSNTARSALIACQIEVGTTPTANTLIYVYLLRGDGTITDDGAGSSDAGITIINAPLLGTILCPAATSNTKYYGVFDTKPLGSLGKSFGVAIVNSTGVALNSTGGNHVINYTLMT